MQIKMFRRAALGTALVAVPLIATGTMTAGASAPHSTVTFKGDAKCGFSGTLTSSPGLTLSSKAVTIGIKLTMTGCTGNISSGGVKITGGTATATVHATASCSSLSKFAPTVKLTWKATGGTAAPTSLYFSNASANVTASPITVTFPGSGGTTKATGSFAGTKSKATAVVQQSINTLLGECSTSKGVTSLTLTKASKITVQ